MSQMTKEINAITGTIIGVSGKLIIYALVILLLVEGMTRGYAFGHEVFYATAMDPEPGIRYALTIPEGQDAAETARVLKDVGLIRNEYAVRIQMWFYDYEVYPGTYELSTAMTSKEILQQLNVKPEAVEESTPAPKETGGPEGDGAQPEEAGDGGEGIAIEEEPEAENGEGL
ncbi:aminodeoxychorismate lyase [Clostridiaceae bacterium]|nr:aminodeoxychorismate lyase [Clostridiaceae bacterium]RKI18317.1 aminodeoxychorismate lyase [bacterium 1XD21-70]